MLVLSFFKAGSVLFSMKSYDIMVSLPVTKSAILISRFVTMYVTNLLFSLIVMIPGLAVHICFTKPGISFYLISLIAVLFAPLLPLTLSSILGAGIKAVSSRMKKKNLVETFLTVALVVIIMVGSFSMGTEAEAFGSRNHSYSKAVHRNAVPLGRHIKQRPGLQRTGKVDMVYERLSPASKRIAAGFLRTRNHCQG
jgi:ABC-type transport system involved in multi-copper enzyme maturation permease subunit